MTRACVLGGSCWCICACVPEVCGLGGQGRNNGLTEHASTRRSKDKHEGHAGSKRSPMKANGRRTEQAQVRRRRVESWTLWGLPELLKLCESSTQCLLT